MDVNATYPEDKELLASLCEAEKERFATWFDELNEANQKRRNTFYSGQPLESSTGVKAWFDYFVNGLTPSEALDEDLTYF